MTLILNCITRDYAIQVSDRLFSYYDPRTGLILKREDDKNKCVLLSDIMSFGYTGLGELGGMNTDSWLSKVIYSATKCNDLQCILNFIRDKATDTFREISYSPIDKRHAFVGIGWTQYAFEENLSPITVVISNYHHNDGLLLERAQNNFNILVSPRFLKKDFHYFSVIGHQPIADDEIKYFFQLNRYLKRCAKKSVGPDTLMAFMVFAIRNMADRYSTIGKNLLGVCLPKTSVNRDHIPGVPGSKFILYGPPLRESPTFFSFLYGGGTQHYGPITVFSPGGAMVGSPTIQISDAENYKEKNRKESVKIWDAHNAVVLTEIVGKGLWTDKRRPEVSDDYSVGYGAFGKVPEWPSGEPSPYYGCLYGIDADSDMLAKIEKDPKYVIILTDKSSLHEVPDDKWIKKLSDWFIDRGMMQDGLLGLLSDINGLKRIKVLEKLSLFLEAARKNMI